MKLAVFDFDGTLAETMAVDGQCFIQAFDEALQIRGFSTQWTDYEHVTDEGVTRKIFNDRFGRHPYPDEIDKIINRFLALLSARCQIDNRDFSPIPGSTSMLNRLRGDEEWGVALATGAWRRSVEFKIARAGLPLAGIPSASAEDGPSRESIVLTAIERASIQYRQSRFDRIVSIGDALWDVRTARKLGLPFLGIAGEPRATLLREGGASHVIENYLDPELCLQLLHEAKPPQ